MHILVLAEGRRPWIDLFESDILKRTYWYKTVEGRVAHIQPNLREVKLYDVSIPKRCMPQLVADLKPHLNTFSKSKRMGWLAAKIMRMFTGLHPIDEIPDPEEYKSIDPEGPRAKHLKKHKFIKCDITPSKKIRKKWVNVLPIGWFDDMYDRKSSVLYLPEGGELI